MTVNRFGIRCEPKYRTVGEQRLLDMLLLSGWVFDLAAGRAIAARTQAASALNGWVSLGLNYEKSSAGERLFDPAEVVNFLIWAGLAGLDGIWVERFVTNARTLVRDWMPVDSLSPVRFTAALRRTLDIRAFARGSKLRLRLPLPLPGHYLRDLEVVPVISPDIDARIGLREGLLELRMTAPGESLAAIGADVTFTAIPFRGSELPGRLEGAERELYLRPAEGLIHVSPRILALANSLAGETNSDWAAIMSFWNYLMDEFTLGMIHYDQVPAGAAGEWVLESGWYDCQLGSALLVSMCRARAIPARIVSGNFLYPVAPTRHYWAEIWVEDRGWLPFDLFTWDLAAGGRDSAWRNYFAGRIDYRMATECLPRIFTGPMSVRLPLAWQMHQSRSGAGVEIAMSNLNGDLVFADRVSVALAGAV